MLHKSTNYLCLSLKGKHEQERQTRKTIARQVLWRTEWLVKYEGVLPHSIRWKHKCFTRTEACVLLIITWATTLASIEWGSSYVGDLAYCLVEGHTKLRYIMRFNAMQSMCKSNMTMRIFMLHKSTNYLCLSLKGKYEQERQLCRTIARQALWCTPPQKLSSYQM